MTDVDQIWHEHHASLRRFIQKRVADKSATDDILQNVFEKIHARLASLKDKQRLQSWLYAITRNAIVDFYRQHKPAEALPEDIPEPDKAEADHVVAELAGCIRPLIRALDKTYREALILSELEGLPQREVAAKLKISLSGAKSRVQRGRAQLRVALLDCCRVELDHRGGISDYTSKKNQYKSC